MRKEKRVEARIGWRCATAVTLCLTLLTGIVVSESAKAQSRNSEDRAADSLAKYTTDLTAAAEQGQFNSIEVPVESTNRAIDVLAGERDPYAVEGERSDAVDQPGDPHGVVGVLEGDVGGVRKPRRR